MRLATIRTDSGTRAVRIDPQVDAAVEIEGVADVGALLADAGWRATAAAAAGRVHALSAMPLTAFAPVVVRPGKIVCVGLNYRAHIIEMGRELPTHPTLFAKFAEAVIGPGDDILIPREASGTVDWEGELAVVVGGVLRHASPARCAEGIAGFTVMNDVTVRAHQYRTTQWLQGKTFESSTPLGPVLVTPDELPAAARLTTTVSGARRQHAGIDDLVFPPAELLSYISRIVTLHPGDVVATGTPGGVGHAADPPDHLADGERVIVSIDGIGSIANRLRIVDPSMR
jgi:acylpyruvate hydrolase